MKFFLLILAFVIPNFVFASENYDVNIKMNIGMCDQPSPSNSYCLDILNEDKAGLISTDPNQSYVNTFESDGYRYKVSVSPSSGYPTENTFTLSVVVYIENIATGKSSGLARTYLIFPGPLQRGMQIYLQIPEFSDSTKKYWGQVILTIT